jgi:microcystin-dependent protein
MRVLDPEVAMRKHVLAAATTIFAAVGPAWAQVDPFVAQVQTFAFNFCPKGWAAMNGQLLPISQNTALFSLIGTRYGGDGRVTFALPVGKPVYSATGEPMLQCIALQGIFPSQN